jgi:hypothetical protein
MWERLKIGDTLVEYDADATREMYAKDAGGINSCKCDYCVNYRLVRAEVYPPEFRALLTRLGIEFSKEVEVDHITEDDSEDGPSYGQSVWGTFAFVGRVLESEGTIDSQDTSRFTYAVSWGKQVHPVTRARFGDSPEIMDLNFWVPYVPKANTTPE